MNCENCHDCSSKCHDIKFGCRVCGKRGMEVSFDTVLALSNEFLRNTLNEEIYYLCTNPNCHVAYYTLIGRVINLSDVNVDIWYKKHKKKFMVCYCRDITLDDVVFAVNSIEVPTIPKVVHFLQKADVAVDCIHHNPTSISCEKLFLNAIEYAKKIKNMKIK